MEIYLFINDDSKNSIIIDFCLQSQKLNFKFHKFSNVKILSDKKKLIIFKEKTSTNFFKRFMKENNALLFKETVFFIPKNFNRKLINVGSKAIYYPTKFIDFESHIYNYFKRKKFIYENLVLRNDSTLFNSITKKKSHLTEIESKIMSLLFQNEIVYKATINKNVLNQSPLIDSKSLDSHLYRLRKKLFIVDSTKKILLTENQVVKII